MTPQITAEKETDARQVELDYLKLRYCGFQKYEVTTMSVAGGLPKKHANTNYKATKPIERTFLISVLDSQKMLPTECAR